MRLFLFLATVLAGTGCGGSDPVQGRTQASERLMAADSTFRHVDNTFVFELPDTGGFLINGQAVPQGDIPAHLAALFGPRAPGHRAVMVWDNPTRREDAQWIARAAMSAGGRAFDAELSGWPSQLPTPP